MRRLYGRVADPARRRSATPPDKPLRAGAGSKNPAPEGVVKDQLANALRPLFMSEVAGVRNRLDRRPGDFRGDLVRPPVAGSPCRSCRQSEGVVGFRSREVAGEDRSGPNWPSCRARPATWAGLREQAGVELDAAPSDFRSRAAQEAGDRRIVRRPGEQPRREGIEKQHFRDGREQRCRPRLRKGERRR